MLELGEPGVTVEWTPPTCFDLSGVTTLTPSHLSGSFFLIDTTTDVTFTCVDPAGLTGMCSFPVVIIPSKHVCILNVHSFLHRILTWNFGMHAEIGQELY